MYPTFIEFLTCASEQTLRRADQGVTVVAGAALVRSLESEQVTLGQGQGPSIRRQSVCQQVCSHAKCRESWATTYKATDPLAPAICLGYSHQVPTLRPMGQHDDRLSGLEQVDGNGALCQAMQHEKDKTWT
ncbi:hypothetical protein AC579_4771 [Pseudocercospora musae]|uniref:Uncharacterized protein n=1 Tax=Pseudocercospora musae TaxID=113226 RepID=A0A139IQR8_9PEZI|nr:hypothetical protein AC579_4771 [Pseudocercospora musae]